MKNTLLILSFLIGIHSFSQAIKGELGFNDGYHQNMQGEMVVIDGYSYFVYLEEVSEYVTYSNLVKIDASGNIVWKKVINPELEENGYTYTADYSDVFHIVPTFDNSIILTEFAVPTCDLGDGAGYLVRKIDQNGNQVWVKRIDELVSSIYPSIFFEELRVNGNNVFVRAVVDNELTFYQLNATTGSITNSFSNNSLQNFWNVDKLGNYYYGVTDNGVVRLTENGEIYDTISEGSEVKAFEIINNHFYTLNNGDVVKQYDLDFNEINSYSFDVQGQPIKWKMLNNTFQVLSMNDDDLQLITLSNNLDLISDNHFNYPEDFATNSNQKWIDFSGTHIGIGLNHKLAIYYKTVRYVYYSLNETVDTSIERVDVELADFDVYNLEIVNPSSAPEHVYNVKAFVKVLVKNNSDYVLNSCRFNHYISYAICNDYVYSNRFDNLNILPGESAWVDLGKVHDNLESLQMENGSYFFELCVYTSSPNDIADLIVENDKFCENLPAGTVDLKEHLLSNQPKKIVKIISLLGQEVKVEPNKLLIYIFEDGTSEKRIITP